MTQTENQTKQGKTTLRKKRCQVLGDKPASSEPKCSLDKSDSLTQTEKILQDLNKQLRLKHNLENCKDKELCNQINKSLYKEIQENGHYEVLKAQAQTLLEAKKEEVEDLQEDIDELYLQPQGSMRIIERKEKKLSSLKSDIKLLESAK